MDYYRIFDIAIWEHIQFIYLELHIHSLSTLIFNIYNRLDFC